MNAIMAVAITARQLGPVFTARARGRNSKVPRPLCFFKRPADEFSLARRVTVPAAAEAAAAHTGRRS